MLQYRLCDGMPLLRSFIKASANINSVIDQFSFGLLCELSWLIIYTLRLCCGCSRMEDSLYVWFFQSSRPDNIICRWKTIDGYLATILSITMLADAVSLGGSPIHLSIFCNFPGISVVGDYIRHYELWPGKPSQARCHVGLYFFKWRLRFFRLLFCNNHCPGML